MNILGLHEGHDASVCLIQDGKIVYNVSEERLNGIKHTPFFPYRALGQFFTYSKLDPKELDYIAVSGLNIYKLFTKIFPKAKITETINFGSTDFRSYLYDQIRTKSRQLISLIEIYNNPGVPSYQKKYLTNGRTKIINVDHHLAHAASAYLTSGFDQCLIITADSIGDMVSLSVSLGINGQIRNLMKVGRSGSLGFFYSLITEGLGWEVNEGEGKTMGLAAYGNSLKTHGVLNEFIPQYKNGRLKKGVDFGFQEHYQSGGSIFWHYPTSEKIKSLVKRYGAENIAAEAQVALEKQMLSIVEYWINKTNMNHLACAGGLFLNVKMNQRIWERNLLKDLFIYPDAGDGGLALGSALLLHQLKSTTRIKKITTAILG